MPGETSFPIDDLIHSVTTQLDLVQDALALKAVNRPLTYALKELSLDLHVFVEMDAEGKVRIRPSGPNETGASTMHLNFTTITRAMVEENTISLAAVRSPSLEELGLSSSETRALERFGIRNAAQLRRVGSSTGVRAIARISNLPLERLRAALNLSKPAVDTVRPVREQPETKPPAETRPPAQTRPPAETRPPVRPVRPDEGGIRFAQPDIVKRLPFEGGLRPLRPEPESPPLAGIQPSGPPRIELPADTRKMRIAGRNLIGETGPAVVRLNHKPLEVSDLDEDGIVVNLPEEARAGSLEVELPDGTVTSYQLAVTDDPWRPGGEGGA